MPEPARLPDDQWTIDELTEDPEIPDVTDLLELIEELTARRDASLPAGTEPRSA